ncbi:Fic family protein [Clostridium gasigenes]|uniref:Fic family protein n=1 Tax=Clostridium gasigenes TaxID=94869 RepID=UPI0014385732|nr:Fic family protein [Clostridium gasigenes]NKF06199.1 Fic family protein [Clostridium gasigenes]QSW20086.1 Fic family protein [Clostridium gasigenes]
MRLTSNQIIEIKKYPNSIYDELKKEFLYHSNKIEGSTFTRENLDIYLKRQIIEGSHKLDDVFETINSLNLFDFVVDTLGEKLSKKLILEFHSILKKNSLDQERGFAGCWKKIPNMISGSSVVLAQPWEVDIKIDELLSSWELSDKDFKSIVKSHSEFETIHPFQDGNGRIGRFIMLKQCIESHIDLIAIDEEYNVDYKKGLTESQVNGNFELLEKVLGKCQNFLEEKNEMLVNTLKCL